MNRIGTGALLILMSASVSAQTTNCLVYPGGVVKCSGPQGPNSYAPSTNCQMGNGMIQCSQPQGIQPTIAPPVPQPMPNYRATPLPPPQSPLLQQQQYLQVQQQQLQQHIYELKQKDYQQQQLELQNQQLQIERQKLQQLQMPEQPEGFNDEQEPGEQNSSDTRLPQPDAILIKSAYCYSEISAELDRNWPSTMQALKDPKTSELEKAALSDMVREVMMKQERVGGYLNKRASSVDNGPLLEPLKQGKADYNQSVVDALTCNQSCPGEIGAKENDECNKKCNQNSSAYQRTKMCDGLEFLPHP